jgi:hypothetical protein
MYAKKPGEQLINGAVLLVEEVHYEDANNRESVVAAAIWGTAQPFVNWRRFIHLDSDGNVTGETLVWGHYYKKPQEMMADFDVRVNDLKEPIPVAQGSSPEANIRRRGFEDGKAAATWLVDGNTPDPYAVLSRLKNGIEDGDPEIMDQLPQPRINGEFADDPTWGDILREETELAADDDGEPSPYEDELFEIYCEAFSNGVDDQITGMLALYDPRTNYGAN